MATIHRLNSDWTLTDDILEPIRLDRPMTIYDALRRENLVPDAHYGMNLNACEWIYNHTFTYEKKFDLPPANDTERTELCFEKMFGKCIVHVNDQHIEPFAPGRYDITGVVQPTDNLLHVIAYETGSHDPNFRYPIGISGSVSITGTNRITVIREEFSAAEDELCCDLTILAHISGKFRFTCVISREGEPIATHEAHQRLIAAEQDVSLRFPLPENAGGMYDVQLTIEHNGLLCDRLRATFAIPVKVADEAVFSISGNSDYNLEPAITALLPLLKDAGFTSIAFSFDDLRTRRVATRMQELGLNMTEADPSAGYFFGCMSLEAMTKYAAGTPLPVAWRLRNKLNPNIDALNTKFGKITRENFAAAIRLEQAADVFNSLVADRMAGKTPQLRCCVDDFPVFYSVSLIDPEGPRPALYAAKQALQPVLAVAECDDVLPCGTLLKLPIRLLTRNARPLPVSVTAAMYTPEGGVIASVSFSAMPGGEPRLGELNVDIPAGLRYALLRTTVEASGEAPVIVDRLIGCGEAILPADLPKTTLADGRCGDKLAYGVVTTNGVRILLPGETAEGCTGEYFNC